MQVNLKKMPSAPKTYVVDFPKLDGGLNIRELNYRLEPNQSPAMKNLWWQDGVLQSRDGQRWLSDDTALGTGWACSPEPFYGHAFFHIGSKLYQANLSDVVTPSAEPDTRSLSTENFTLVEVAAEDKPEPAPELPDAPTGLTASVTAENLVTVIWTAPERAEKYLVERAVYGESGWGAWTELSRNLTETTVNDSDVTTGGRYRYRVRAYNISGAGEFSGTAEVTISEPEPGTPGAPTNVTAVLGNDGVTVSWTRPENADTCTVERCEPGGEWTVKASGLVIESWVDSLTDQGKQYQYRVQAFNDVGGGYYSDVVSVTIPLPVATPEWNVISRVAQEYTDAGKVKLEWFGPNGATYSVERSEYGANGWGEWAVKATGVSASSWVDSGTVSAADDPPYRYRVRAHKAGRDSLYSDARLAPGNACIVAASVSGTTLTWSAVLPGSGAGVFAFVAWDEVSKGSTKRKAARVLFTDNGSLSDQTITVGANAARYEFYLLNSQDMTQLCTPWAGPGSNMQPTPSLAGVSGSSGVSRDSASLRRVGTRTLAAQGLTIPENRGTFFRYDGYLFYKNRGGFYRISYHEGHTPLFTVADMTWPGNTYTPVIVINADPGSGSGTLYQPENRLSSRKEIWYNAASGVADYFLPGVAEPGDYVISVTVDGNQLTEGVDYDVELRSNLYTVVHFRTGHVPTVTPPQTNNTVKIVYSRPNPDALASVLDCNYAVAAGDNDNLCILLAGCPAQKNAVFWNANDDLAMNAGYFPMTNYNLCGDTDDTVAGFGKQYNDLIVFKERSIGKLTFSVESVNNRDSILFAYQNINANIGCDLPWSIQIIENNLVFANRRRGVHMILSSSAAYENNIICLSENVNGVAGKGLLEDLRGAEHVTSVDHDDRYWLVADGVAYAWDYSVSTYAKPSWFYFTGVHAASFFRDEAEALYHLDAQGRVTAFERSFADYGGPIDKSYTFPTQFFGGYELLKDVMYLLITTRGDTDTMIDIRYDTDYEQRYDLTPINLYAWHLIPRNLSWRSFRVIRYGFVSKRTPGCRHIRHFSMTLSNNNAREDLSIVSAQIYYRYSGKER